MKASLSLVDFLDCMDTSEVLELAADGDTAAQYKLARRYEYGDRDMPEDKSEAIKWYRLSADGGNAIAQGRLGFIYHFGTCGVAEDANEALKWLQLAADQHDSDAQEQVGTYYRLGLGGLTKNDEEAFKWYERAGIFNSAAAEKVADYYFLGLGGVSANEHKSLEWYQTATEADDSVEKYKALADGGDSADAQKKLGDIYQLGLCGVSVDKAKALVWYRRAATQMNAVAQKRVAQHERQMRRRRTLGAIIITALITCGAAVILWSYVYRGSERENISSQSRGITSASDGVQQPPSTSTTQLERAKPYDLDEGSLRGSSGSSIPSNQSVNNVIEVCEIESNIFNKNNCRWRQCAKQENRARTECEIFQPKDDANR